MKLLVFGGSGLVGTELEYAAGEVNAPVVSPGRAEVNITDAEAVSHTIRTEKADAVINLVAIPSINPCEEDPDTAFSLHVTAPLHMAKACAKVGCVFIQASSHAVFDGTKVDAYTEEDLPNPLNVYGASKVASELLTKNLCPRHYVVRFATMYGRRRNKAAGFVDKMVELMLARKSLIVADDKLDSPSNALDVGRSLIDIVSNDRDYGIYHVVNSGQVSYFDFIVRLRDLMGLENEIQPGKDADFPALGKKPLRTALKSIKLPEPRSWNDALEAYVEECL